jgi:adenylate kinase family enzyme
VLLHTSRWIALSRVIRRTVAHLGQYRADRAGGCNEKLDWEFVKYILRFDIDRKPLIMEAIETYGGKATALSLMATLRF